MTDSQMPTLPTYTPRVHSTVNNLPTPDDLIDLYRWFNEVHCKTTCIDDLIGNHLGPAVGPRSPRAWGLVDPSLIEDLLSASQAYTRALDSVVYPLIDAAIDRGVEVEYTEYRLGLQERAVTTV